MLSALDISTSALVAQRTRLNAISSNLANMSSVRNEDGDIAPYKARYVVLQTDDSVKAPQGAVGVKVSSIETETIEPRYKFEPGHPLAIKSGKWKDHVAYPQINMNTEFVDALEATRAYEANIGVMEVTKNIAMQTMRILA
jgi:flagellar basal-body rod protein FlgC